MQYVSLVGRVKSTVIIESSKSMDAIGSIVRVDSLVSLDSMYILVLQDKMN